MKIHYLTWLSDRLGKASEELELPSNITEITHLMDYLESKEGVYKSIFTNRHIVCCAIDGTVVGQNHKIHNTNTISFFAAIAGG